MGIGVSVVASIVNLSVALVLLKASKRSNSITLEANSQHLMTDVWASAGVLAGVGAVALTGWEKLDPIVAFIVAGNIIWSGVRIVRKSVLGLMDTALPAEEQSAILRVLEEYSKGRVRSDPIGKKFFLAADDCLLSLFQTIHQAVGKVKKIYFNNTALRLNILSPKLRSQIPLKEKALENYMLSNGLCTAFDP